MAKNNKIIPTYNPSFPQMYVSPIIKVLNELDSLLSKSETNGQTTIVELKVGETGKKPVRIPVKVYYRPVSVLNEDENNKLKEALTDKNGNFSEFDRAVFGAVASLKEAGNEYMTPATIYRLMTGSPETTAINPKQEERIQISLRKMCQIYTEIDYTEQARMYPDLDISNCVINGYMLSGSFVHVLAGGHQVRAFKLDVFPPLYEYAKKLRQIMSIRFEWLQVGGDNTPSRIAARMYMLRRVLARTKKMSNSILYSSIYRAANVQEARQRIRLHDFIQDCLKKWVKLGVIDNYTIRSRQTRKLIKYYAIDIIKANSSAAIVKEEPSVEKSEYDILSEWIADYSASFNVLGQDDFLDYGY